MRVLVLVALTLALAPARAVGQTPIDPLVRPADEEGRFSYSLSLGYTPGGREGAGVNHDGLTYSYRRVTHSLALTIAGRYIATPTLSIGASLSPALAVSQEERRFAGNHVQPIWQSRLDAAASLQLDMRIAPDSHLDPRVALTLSHPWALGLTGSASLLRDPVVLSANLSVSKPFHAPGAYLGLGLAAGLVANQEVTLAASIGMTLPIGVLDPPRTAIGFRAAYALDPESRTEIALRMDLIVAGGESRAGLAVELSGR